MGWCIAIGVVLLLAFLPLGVRVRYDGDGARAILLAGPVRLALYPKKPASQKKKTKTETKSETEMPPTPAPVSEAGNAQPAEEKPGGSWRDFLPLVKLALKFLGDLRRKLRIDRLDCRLVLAGEDPCDLAQTYGRAWAAVGNLLAAMEKTFRIQKRDVEVLCDFQATETKITFRADVSICLGRLLALVVRYGIRALKEYLTLRKIRKGGMNHE